MHHMKGGIMATSLSAQRWAILSVFCMSSALSAFIWICIAPVQPLVSTLYQQSALAVDQLSMVFFIAYLPASILGIYLMERYGLRVTLTLGAIGNAVCVALKLAGAMIPGEVGFTLLVGGQVVGSIAQPLIVNPVPRLAMDHFSDGERDMATVLATQANIVGQLAANLVPPLVMTEASGQQLAWLHVPQLALGIVIAVATAIIVRDRPEEPPSESAARQWALTDGHGKQARATGAGAVSSSTEERLIVKAQAAAGVDDIKVKLLSSADALDSPDVDTQAEADPAQEALTAMWRDVRTLLKDRNFGLLNLGFSIGTGMAWALLTVEAQMLSPCGYSGDVIGYSGAALMGLGMLTSVVAAPIMTRFRAYCRMQWVVMAWCLLASVMVLAVNRPGNSGLIIGAWLLLGAGLQPLVPLTLEHAAEMTYPVPADVSSALLQVGGNLVSTVQTFALSPLLNLAGSVDCSTTVNPAAGFILANMVVGAAVTACVRPRMARTNAGKEAQADAEAEA